MKIKALATLTFVLFLYACSSVPVTGRKQMNLISENDMIAMSVVQYDAFLEESDVVSPYQPDAKQVLEVGRNIAEAAQEYLKRHGQLHRVSGFEWEFNLVEDDMVNAWCMPGGKVVFYTGILPYTQDETGMAVVMGHEVAHAIARHGNERMSQQLMIQYGGQTLNALLSTNPSDLNYLFMTSYGVAGNLGSLAFSRSQETEADKLGLVFMAMAGYDPREAPVFWERMAEAGGAKPPEWLSTHPSDQSRVEELRAYMMEAMKYYTPAD